MGYNETKTYPRNPKMFNPIKAVKTEITGTRANIREFITGYKYERMIAKSQAKLAETTQVPGYVNVYA